MEQDKARQNRQSRTKSCPVKVEQIPNTALNGHTLLNQKINPYFWRRKDEIVKDLENEEGMCDNYKV
jgi:hypothetical protein